MRGKRGDWRRNRRLRMMGTFIQVGASSRPPRWIEIEPCIYYQPSSVVLVHLSLQSPVSFHLAPNERVRTKASCASTLSLLLSSTQPRTGSYCSSPLDRFQRSLPLSSLLLSRASSKMKKRGGKPAAAALERMEKAAAASPLLSLFGRRKE